MKQRNADRGSVLILVMLVVVILGAVVIALADYSVSTLRQGRVVENRADRLSAAEGAMRDQIDRLSGDGSLCTTAFGSTGAAQAFPIELNESTITRTCEPIGLSLSAVTGWAVVITGEGGVPDGQGLITQSGGDKVFGGETYIARPGLLGLQKELVIKDGNMWYSDSSCAPEGEYIGSTISNLSFDPAASQGLWCTGNVWSTMFPEPTTSTLGSLSVLNADPYNATTNPNGSYEDRAGCRVFFPGKYTFEPNFDDNNYMLSGDYWFALPGNSNTAKISITKEVVTAGYPAIAGDEQIIANAPCDAELVNNNTGQGATFYLDGNTNIVVDKGTGTQSGALEIFRRAKVGTDTTDFVSIHALPTHTLPYTTPFLSTGSGNNKEMAIHGQIWAPRGRLEFGNVTNEAKGQILGGAVVASIIAQSSASASGFVVKVAGSPQEVQFRLQAIATKEGSTTVQVIAQLRFDPPPTGTDIGQWRLAVNSWRVCDGSAC